MTSYELLEKVEDVVRKMARNELDVEELGKQASEADPEELKKAFLVGVEAYCHRNGITDENDKRELAKRASELYMAVAASA